MPLTPAQTKIFDSEARFRVVSAGRRFGKSFLSIWEMARAARHPGKNIFYIAPSYRQAKQIIWDTLKYELGKRNWIKRVNESDLSVTLKNNSKISLRSADNPDSMRGVSLDMAILDEAAFMKKETWTEVIRPALSDKQGNALFITTPKGRNWIYDLHTDAKILDDWSAFQFTTIEGGNVLPEEVEAAKRELDEKTFRQEYEATFETYSGLIYYNFDPERNVKNTDIQITNKTLLHIGVDFNVDPMSASIATVEDGHIHIFDEIVLNGSNTYELVEAIQQKYPDNRIWCYPDASGQARKTSSNTSDHNILRQGGFTLKVNRSNPPVADRIASVNSCLSSSAGVIKLTISPKCKQVIKSLNNQVYKEGTRIPDKTGLDHQSDTVGYICHYVHPIRRPTTNAGGPQTFGHF